MLLFAHGAPVGVTGRVSPLKYAYAYAWPENSNLKVVLKFKTLEG